MDRTEEHTRTPRKSDADFVKNEFKEFLYFLNRQLFGQIPSVSAVAGIIAGAWVVSTFTASPIKGALAEWGFTDGVQKALKAFREMQIEVGEARAARLSEEVRAELQGKLTALEAAREAGILSWNEYRTKMANIYQPYVKKPGSKVEDLIVSKLTTKIQ
jgi:hypothetical protein